MRSSVGVRLGVVGALVGAAALLAREAAAAIRRASGNGSPRSSAQAVGVAARPA